MLGDTAVAVHPEDARYAGLVGRHAIVPLTGRRIPIVADTYSDPEKGTGAVKITPAHDFNDFEVGRRHDLPMPSVLDREARVTLAEIELAAVPGIADPAWTARSPGRTASAPASAIVAELERLELLVKTEPHTHQVPHGDRSDVPIEPLLTVQWYADAATLAGPAIAAVESGPHRVRAEAVGEHVLRLDARHPALVHQPPALVGPPHPGLVRPGRRGVRGRDRGGRAGRGAARITAATRRWCRTRTCWTPGSARRCGRSRPWAGRSGRRSWRATIPATCWSPGSTSSSSGSPG